MMNRSTGKTIWTAVAATALTMITLGIVPQMSAAQGKPLSHKELNQLIATAAEPQDHLRIAQYYTAEANRLETTAKEHEEMAEAYRHNTTSGAAAMKNPGGPSTVAHCEFFEKSMRDAAQADRELAAEHEQMAKDASAKRAK